MTEHHTEASPVVEEDAAELPLSLPDDPEEARDLLVAELSAASEDAQTYLEDLKRVAADFENYRKRTQREMADNVERASQRVILSLLPVLDSFDLAVAHEPESDSEAKLLGGVNSTRQQLLDALAKEGLEPIQAVGELFDPEVHEAAAMEGSPEHPVVVSEIRRGYILRGRVIRPALVAVGEDPLVVDEQADG